MTPKSMQLTIGMHDFSSNQLIYRLGNFPLKKNSEKSTMYHVYHNISCDKGFHFTVWKNEKFSLTEIFFVKSTTYLVISLVKPLFSRNFCEKRVRENFRNFHSVHSVEKRKIWSHQKNISSNQLFSNFFSKTIVFTKFLLRNCEREFLKFPHCVWEALI